MKKTLGVIIAAGGASSRMGGIDKQFALIAGTPVLARSCIAFERNDNVSSIVVVTKDESVSAVKDMLSGYGITKLAKVVCGGMTRAESAQNGFRSLPQCDYVAVHDGARPLVSETLINDCLAAAVRYGAAVPAVCCEDTLKAVADGEIKATVDRSGVMRAQTPQIFGYSLFESVCGESLTGGALTDDAAYFEKAGIPVHICAGEKSNIKITVPEDLRLARFYLCGESFTPRIGHGYDAHRLVPGRRLVLCGAEIKHDTGLLGHSDADVAVHAVIDALLGAAALGDIGSHFPDTDSVYKDADSIIMLKSVVDLIRNNGYTIGNIDTTVICQSPKLSPYIEQMRKNLSSACGCEIERISVKATTEERMGFTGEGLGIAAHAVCILV